MIILRCIISQDIEEQCSKILKKEKNELKKGVVAATLFNEICNMHGKDSKVIKSYLLKFDLAVELQSGLEIFIPSLVSENNEVNKNQN